MKIQVLTNPDSVAQAAAKFIAAEARASVTARGRFIVAVSGGRTPWQMLRGLAGENVPWRVRTRPPCYINYQTFPKMIEGHMISDVVAVLGSINVIAAELDR